MRRLFVPLLALPLLASCAGVTSRHHALKPAPNKCQSVEFRTTIFSTHNIAVCWNENGQVIGFSGTGGMPVVKLPLEIIGSVSTVATAAVGGYFLKSAAGELSKLHLGIDGGGSIELTADPELLEQLRELSETYNIEGGGLDVPFP